jgi:hypothetical protein
MSTIQPSSLTNDELLRHAEDMLITTGLDKSPLGLPPKWQVEIIVRLRRLLDLNDVMYK